MNEKSKKRIGDVPKHTFCSMILSPYSIFLKIEYGVAFLSRGRRKKYLSHINIILNELIGLSKELFANRCLRKLRYGLANKHNNIGYTLQRKGRGDPFH